MRLRGGVTGQRARDNKETRADYTAELVRAGATSRIYLSSRGHARALAIITNAGLSPSRQFHREDSVTGRSGGERRVRFPRPQNARPTRERTSQSRARRTESPGAKCPSEKRERRSGTSLGPSNFSARLFVFPLNYRRYVGGKRVGRKRRGRAARRQARPGPIAKRGSSSPIF